MLYDRVNLYNGPETTGTKKRAPVKSKESFLGVSISVFV